MASEGRERVSLFEHALALHLRNPDEPLPDDGVPFPDEDRDHDAGWPRNRDLHGVDVARILDAHFADPEARPVDLVDAFHDVHVPIFTNDHIGAAALRADPERVRATGRWLVRHSDDRCSALVGLALLGVEATPDDIPLIQTIGLLAEVFGALAARALDRVDPDAQALLWLGDRTAGWGRIYVVGKLLGREEPQVRPWLLRNAVQRDDLGGYYAFQVAKVAALHEEIVRPDPDAAFVDQTGEILLALAGAQGMGPTLADYPHAVPVLTAHLGQMAGLEPTVRRFKGLVALLYRLVDEGYPSDMADGCRELLDRADWVAAGHAGLNEGDSYLNWLRNHDAQRLAVRAFETPPL